MLALALGLAAADPVSPTPAADASVDAAVQVVRDFYAAVRAHDYRRAYAIWHGRLSYARFRQGYAQTRSVTVTPLPPFGTEGAAGSVYAKIRVRVDAVTYAGRHQHLTGSYTLRRVNDVEGSTAVQRRWHIETAQLRATAKS